MPTATDTPTIPDEAEHLLEGKHFAALATLMPDGTPQVTPVWIDHENGTLVVNTETGRLKPRNMERDPRVTVMVYNRENPYEYLQVRGRVDELTSDGAEQHIDDLAKRYMGVDEYPLRNDDEDRLIARIRPAKVDYSPGG